MDRKTIVPKKLLELLIYYSNNEIGFNSKFTPVRPGDVNHHLINVKNRILKLEKITSDQVNPNLLFEDYNVFLEVLSFYLKNSKLNESDLKSIKKIKGPVVHIESHDEYIQWAEFELLLTEIKNIITPLNYDADKDNYLRVMRIMLHNIIDATYEYRINYLNNI